MIAGLLALALVTAPNLSLTPGVVRALAPGAICAIRWSRDRRHVTIAMKREVMRRYGYPWSTVTRYEIDHLIPRELGGADTIENLWPQPWPDAHRKDRRENAANVAVCRGRITLSAALEEMRQWGRSGP